MATQYIHKKYFTVPHNANALTKMHVRQSNAQNVGMEEVQPEDSATTEKYAITDFVLFIVLPAGILVMFGAEFLHRIFE